jgi:hypothetical protein
MAYGRCANDLWMRTQGLWTVAYGLWALSRRIEVAEDRRAIAYGCALTCGIVGFGPIFARFLVAPLFSREGQYYYCLCFSLLARLLVAPCLKIA